MTQIAGRPVEHQEPKNPESSFSWPDWLSDWLCLTLYAQTGVQWLATPLSRPDPLQLASRGWSSPAILPTWDRTNNRKVINPTPTPTKPRWLWQFRQNFSLRTQKSNVRSGPARRPPGWATKVKKIKIQFQNNAAMLRCDCCDVML